MGSEMILISNPKDVRKGRKVQWQAIWSTAVRDRCTCPRCVDSSSGQRTFVPTEIRPDIELKSMTATDEGLVVTFNNDIERLLDENGDHPTLIPWSILQERLKDPHPKEQPGPASRRNVVHLTGITYWDREKLASSIRKIDYKDYMEDEAGLWAALLNLGQLGIVFLKNVPEDPESVIRIATRIANIKETLYGRTFDVRAKPNAENVAYTDAALCLHQDLLYHDSAPMIQVLHCMENSCSGGDSLFSDGDRVGNLLYPHFKRGSIKPLLTQEVPYVYNANGHKYHRSHSVISLTQTPNPTQRLRSVYWSPPFAGSRPASWNGKAWIKAARLFDQLLSHEDGVYRTRMEPGECVLFNNRRLMHGRTAFDAAGGSRWLRGAYIDKCDFMSKMTRIPPDVAEAARGDMPVSLAQARKELNKTWWEAHVLERILEMERGR